MPSLAQVKLFLSAVIILLITILPHVYCGFTETIEGHHRVDQVGLPRTPRVRDNTSITADTKDEKRQAFIPANIASYHSALANMANFGGFGPMSSMGSLRTVMMGGMLYGLSLIPAVVLALGGSGLPMGGLLSSLGLSKRALPETSSAKMPLLSETQTRRLLQMLQSAFKQWNIADEECKQLFVCQMYRQVSSNGVSPDLELFKEALIHILERGGQRRAGRAAEHLLAEYEHYFAAARMGMKQDECEASYPKCSLSLYPLNEGFQRSGSKKTTNDKNKTTNTRDKSSKTSSKAKTSNNVSKDKTETKGEI